MINYIDLTGFKSFVADTIDFGKLTLLTGLNSSGKSSVIQAILMLEKAVNGAEILLEGHGDLSELKNGYSESLEICGEIEGEGEILIKNGEIILDKPITFPQIIYISANRFGPETTIPVFVGGNFSLGNKGENLLKSIEHYEDYGIPEILRHESAEGFTFAFNLEAWLAVVSPNIKFKKEIQRKSDTSFATFNGHRAKNVGFGLSYTLPVITALLLGSIIPNSLVIIENPEAHLHPRGQSEMARLIGLCIKAGVQVIVETHSDHLLNGIRVFAKNDDTEFIDGTTFNKNIHIYWFELDKNGNTESELITVDENGRLENCPTGLLDQFEINARKLL
jgi:predicted ATPase